MFNVTLCECIGDVLVRASFYVSMSTLKNLEIIKVYPHFVVLGAILSKPKLVYPALRQRTV